MVQSSHTVTAFEEDMKFLAHKIAEMGGLAERMVENAIRALIKSDLQLAQKTIADDAQLDEAQALLDEKVVLIIAQRQPMASDLREVFSTIRIAADLERVGDLAKNIAKRVVAISERGHSVNLARGIEHLGDLALAQMKEVLDAFGSRSVTRINMIRDRDDEIDAMYTSLFRELLTYMMEDPRNITTCTHLLFCAKNIERIGDHATNIAESVYYIVTGKHLAADRPKEDKTHRIVIGEADG
ncbi:phosphate signaling complex protein PhoU [Oricola cellulosilytica]|uniref:Phosphate-specific transport system accessory protein PhoU n=1 Tax=Oricola cellulosilytica TaxID=1429082 RepID=A0A4R0PHK7_9HYPH|nr:phosphate signaling complex protein PhoU [Oricola cellulosilytica]TCD16498.1 phosphate signaling complex protein PhoU [Oricola cellulosilytica]